MSQDEEIMHKTLIIIPAYNEFENICRVLASLKEEAPDADPLVINDCSTDGTRELLLTEGVDHLSLPINLGIGGGVQAGYLYALENGYDIAIQFDGDGQHDASCIASLVQPLREGLCDVVIGSRFLRGEGFQSSAVRRAGIRFLSELIRFLTGQRVTDVTSGFRAVNRRMIRFYLQSYAQDYPEPEAIISALMTGATVMEVPALMHERQGGRSSISMAASVYYMVKVSLAIIIRRLSG